MIPRALSMEVAAACSKIRQLNVVSVARSLFLALESKSFTSRKAYLTSQDGVQVAVSNAG
jgi:hypothetical protein